MNRLLFAQSFSFLVLVCLPLIGNPIGVEELEGLLRSADTPASQKRTYEIAWNNLDLVAKVMELRGGDGLSRRNALVILQNASFLGKFPHQRFFNLVIEQIFKIEEYVRRNINEELKFLEVLIVFHGYAPGAPKSLSLLKNFLNLECLIIALETCGEVSKGILARQSFFEAKRNDRKT